MKKGLSATGFFLLYLLLLAGRLDAEECKLAARLIAAEGQVEFRHDTGQSWQPVSRLQKFCQGDQIQVKGVGRAALRMVNETLVRLDQNTSLVFTRIKPRERSLLDLIKGAIHSISRTPKSLDIRTPFVNAAIEGTEFMVSTTTQGSRVAVIEGRVVTSNKEGSITLEKGQVADIAAGRKPRRNFTLKPVDTVVWTLHYPSIFGLGIIGCHAPGDDPQLAFAEKTYRAGDPLRALELLNNAKPAEQGLIYQLLIADIYLSLGDAGKAQFHLRKAGRLNPSDARMAALNGLIALVQNHIQPATRKIETALKHDPRSPVVQLAASYLKQHELDIPAALQHARQAATLAPDNAITQARLAEVLLMTGDSKAAENHAKKATRLDPNSAQAYSQLGFAALYRLNPAVARNAFNKAIQLDASAPHPYLGLGLLEIRQNHLKAGREALETATLLDPGSALIRSYLGKAYYEERRFPLAADQFKLSEQIDPNDPTPWFYDSILLQTLNQPAKALKDLQKAIALNDKRAIYRSHNLLDEDAAARSVSLGRIYTDLGFRQLARTQATNALALNPDDHTAHRLLSDSYQGFNQFDASRRSELLQAQLHQPLNLMPIQPELALSNLGILDSSGPGSLSYNEYNPMFIREGLFAQLDGLAAGQGTLANDLIIAGLKERYAFSASQFHYETDGPRDNSDFKRDSYSVFGQFEFAPKSNLQLSYSKEDEDKGNVTQRFIMDHRNPKRRFSNQTREFHAGLNWSLSSSTSLLISNRHFQIDSQENRPRTASSTSSVLSSSEARVQIPEIQISNKFADSQLIAGLSRPDMDSQQILTLDFSPAPCPVSFGPGCTLAEPGYRHQTHAYGYLYQQIRSQLNMTYGLAWVKESEKQDYSDTLVLPKLGLDWQTTPSSHIRAAVYSTYSPNLPASIYQTIEPTQVVGFTQLFDEALQTRATNYGAGWDGKLSEKTNSGLNLLYRDTETAFLLNVRSESFVRRVSSRYLYANAYLHWIPEDAWAFSLEYFYNRSRQETDKLRDIPSFAPDGVLKLETHSMPLTISYNHPSGITGQLCATYYNQSGRFATDPQNEVSDNFWLTDLNITYRPHRYRFSFSAGIQNLFDQAFQFEDQNSYDILTPESSGKPSQLSSERLFFAKSTLSFR